MTDEQMRVAIAEATDFKPERPGYWVRKDGQSCVAHSFHFNGFPLPDYLNDLNECAEFEKTLTKDQHDIWRDHLRDICLNDWLAGKHYTPFGESATARQRCIAFLKTLNLYTETK